MCALTPMHAVIPADTFGGITLQSDGTVQFLAYDAPLFRPRGPASYEGDPEQPPILPSQWSVSPDGRLLSKSEVDFPAEGFLVSIEGASQDGSLLAGLHTSETSDVILNGKTVVWQRETNELIPVAPSLEKSFLIVRGMSNEGDVIFWADVDGVTRSFVKDPTGVVHDLPSVHAQVANTGTGSSPVFVYAISADGQTIVGACGEVGGGGAEALPPRATIWKNGIAHELPTGGYSQSWANAVSDDGRVIGGSVGDGTITRAAVWVDGVLQQSLVDDPNGTQVLQVVNGIGGDPTTWAAMGYDWVTRSDGVVRSFYSGLLEPYGLSLTGANRGMKLLANDDALFLVTLESPSWTSAGFSARLATHVFVLPTDHTYSQSDALDLSGDHQVSPLDALLVINALNGHPNTALVDLPAIRQAIPKIDTSGDGELSPADALRIINYLNDSSPAAVDNLSTDNAASAEGEAASSNSAFSTDDYFNLLGSENPRRKR